MSLALSLHDNGLFIAIRYTMKIGLINFILAVRGNGYYSYFNMHHFHLLDFFFNVVRYVQIYGPLCP